MGSNAYLTMQQLPTPTAEICKDPQRLAGYLSKLQLVVSQLRHFRVIKCPNCVMDVVNSGDAETLVRINNPGFKLGSIIFGHAIFTHRVDGSGSATTVPTQNFSGFLRNLRFTTDGGAVFNVSIPSSPAGKTVWEVHVIAFEGET